MLKHSHKAVTVLSSLTGERETMGLRVLTAPLARLRGAKGGELLALFPSEPASSPSSQKSNWV